MTTKRTAANLPADSVVAVGRDVYIKRIIQPGTPGHEEFWIAAMTFGVPMENWPMQRGMDRDGSTILRVGDGTGAESLRHDLDRALAAGLPRAGGRIEPLIRRLQEAFAEVDAERAKFAPKTTDA